IWSIWYSCILVVFPVGVLTSMPTNVPFIQANRSGTPALGLFDPPCTLMYQWLFVSSQFFILFSIRFSSPTQSLLIFSEHSWYTVCIEYAFVTVPSSGVF